MVHGGECDQHGPCMNGGRCYSGDQAPRCDCSRIAYEGPYCEKDDVIPVDLDNRRTCYCFSDVNSAGG
ncbi:Contactin-associated protein like 5-3 [Portunus trituberculatus]|uniref:Contactin-associated protein like 5-3 n=1 Tax=Portunus trituberculatus TaxID=210409 RepID=A0A5B7H6T7_PORTR|nr:Contactin-associated protein like 5-3 [Portunus trituberculatus]